MLSKNEKANLYAIYVNQECIIKQDFNTHRTLLGFGHLYRFVAHSSQEPLAIKDIELLLTPLPKITNEHAIEVAKMQSLNEFDYVMAEFGKEYANDNRLLCDIFAYTFLQSKGYDLPSYYLEGSTYIKSVLATDKTLL
jgi:hypothetical protein